jgi:hypothetical protein
MNKQILLNEFNRGNILNYSEFSPRLPTAIHSKLKHAQLIFSDTNICARTWCGIIYIISNTRPKLPDYIRGNHLSVYRSVYTQTARSRIGFGSIDRYYIDHYMELTLRLRVETSKLKLCQCVCAHILSVHYTVSLKDICAGLVQLLSSI